MPTLTLHPDGHFSPEPAQRYPGRALYATVKDPGFHNTVGFNDETRALLSIPGRHDVARKMNCRFLAQLVTEH